MLRCTCVHMAMCSVSVLNQVGLPYRISCYVLNGLSFFSDWSIGCLATQVSHICPRVTWSKRDSVVCAIEWYAVWWCSTDTVSCSGEFLKFFRSQ